MSSFYLLNDQNECVSVETVQEWAEQWDEGRKRVGLDKIGSFRISTVFLGIDHSITAIPALFETMIFRQREYTDLYCERYGTWLEAKEGHDRIVKLAQIFLQKEEDFK